MSIYDSALMFGDMVFEMTRSFNRRHFRLEEHVNRLFAGLKVLRIDCGMSPDDLVEVCLETSGKNEAAIPIGDEHRLMINVSRGPLAIYHECVPDTRPTVVVADFPLSWTTRGLAHLLTSGINAVVPAQRAIPSQLLDPKVKNRSRLHYQMANIQVAGYSGANNWALLLDPDGLVAEGTGSNFFIVKAGQVLTPRGANVLRGISRDYVMELCAELKIPASEADLDVYDVMSADEAFFTGTPFCMLPAVSIDGVPIGSQEHADERLVFGQVSARLAQRWSSNVGVDFAKQMQQFASSDTPHGPTPYSFR